MMITMTTAWQCKSEESKKSSITSRGSGMEAMSDVTPTI